jgi:hypothetical protein
VSFLMRHPETGGTYAAQPSQVPHLQASGWQVVEGQAEQGEVWPLEVQRFEGQPPIRLRHPDLDEEITVAESAVPFHREKGWLIVDDEPAERAEAAPSETAPEAADDLDGKTVPQLQELARARGLPVSGTKPELLERLRSTPATPATEVEATASPADSEEGE